MFIHFTVSCRYLRLYSFFFIVFFFLLLRLDTFNSFICKLWGSAGKESACNVGDLGLIPGFGRFPGEGKGYPLQYSGLENSMDCIVHGDTKSQTQLSDFHFHSDLVINRGFCPDSQMPAEPPAEISSWISGSEWSQVLFPVLICSLNIWVRELAVFPSGTWEWREA